MDYLCDLTAVPVEDGRFDRVVFNQVLEHLPEPERAVGELFRVRWKYRPKTGMPKNYVVLATRPEA